MPTLPVVAIVGRPNVGKSACSTPWSASASASSRTCPASPATASPRRSRSTDRYVELVDTGGYGFVDPDQLTEHIKHQIELAMSRADLVLFIVDCQDGLTSADEEIAAPAAPQGHQDGPGRQQGRRRQGRCHRSATSPAWASARRSASRRMNDRNIDQVCDAIAQNVDLTDAADGDPRAGDAWSRSSASATPARARWSTRSPSSTRAIGDRVIVSEVPGTTRDSVDVRFEKDGKTLIVIDTAGVRKKRHMVTNDIEFYSFHRAQRSIRRADVVLC